MKELTFDLEGRKKLMSGIEKISRAVKSTLGPLGKTVLWISMGRYWQCA